MDKAQNTELNLPEYADINVTLGVKKIDEELYNNLGKFIKEYELSRSEFSSDVFYSNPPSGGYMCIRRETANELTYFFVLFKGDLRPYNLGEHNSEDGTLYWFR